MNSTLNHSPRKRRNLCRWMESRLRRLSVEIERFDCPRPGIAPSTLTTWVINRRRDRAHQLACAIQIEWGHRHAAKVRATL